MRNFLSATIVALAVAGCGQAPEKRSVWSQPTATAEMYGVTLQDGRIAHISQRGATVAYVYSTDIDGVTWFVPSDGNGRALHGTLLRNRTGEQMVSLLPSS